MNAEFRVLRAPAATLDALAASADRGAWTLVRRPLLLTLAMGLTLSIASSTRVSARVVADGMISFAFLPIAEALAVGVVYLRGDRHLPLTRVVDMFFVTNSPWLLWILGLCAWLAAVPQSSTTLLSYSTVNIILASMVAPACWAAYLDFQFFRLVLRRRSGNAAWADLFTARAIGWVVALGYFFGIAAWAQIVAWVR
jgi:hypothetical protein